MKARMPFNAGAVVLAFAVSAVCVAQSKSAPAPTRSRVQQVHVKPEMINEWRDLQKNEVVPALKKGGIKTRTVYQTSVGAGFEFLVVTPFAKFSEFDGDGAQVKALGAAAAARLGEKLRKCTEGNQNWFITELTALGNVVAGAPAPAMIVSTRVRVAPGRMQDLQNLLKSDVLPVYQKSKTPLTVNLRGMGANPNDVVVTSPIAKYADLDLGSPLERALGQEGMAKLLAKFTGLVTPIETIVRTRVADLSF